MQRFPLMLLVTVMQCCGATAIAQSTKTILDQPLDQQASVKKILSLGGDWEAPSKTVLIGFIGAKFTNETFELLKPLVEMRILYLSDIPANDKAFEHCKDLEALEEIQIRDCKFDGTGLKHLAKCKRLKRVIIAANFSGIFYPITLAAITVIVGVIYLPETKGRPIMD